MGAKRMPTLVGAPAKLLKIPLILTGRRAKAFKPKRQDSAMSSIESELRIPQLSAGAEPLSAVPTRTAVASVRKI
jgi:hypothetical protein